SLALDTCASPNEKIAQLGRVIIAVVGWIEPKKYLAIRGEVIPQITQEEIPFRNAPPFLRRMVKIEVDRKRGDPIELLTKIRQRLDVCVLGVARGRIRVSLLDFAGAFPIDLRQHRTKRHPENGALRSAPAAPVGQRLGKFENLTG